MIKSAIGLAVLVSAPLLVICAFLVFAAQQATHNETRHLANSLESVRLSIVNVKARIRMPEEGVFSEVDLNSEFVPFELWGRSTGGGGVLWKARTGHCTIAGDNIYSRNMHDTLKSSVIQDTVFDGWLSPLATSNELIEVEHCLAHAHDEKVESVGYTDSFGSRKLRLTFGPRVSAAALVDMSETIQSMLDPRLYREYTLDQEHEQLESIRVYAMTDTTEILLFETASITYASSPREEEEILAELPPRFYDEEAAAAVAPQSTGRPMHN